VLRQFVSRFAPKKLCLVADSSLAIRRAAASILHDLGFHVMEAENSAETLSKYRTQAPDAVLVDGAFALDDEFAVLQELAENAGPGRPKIILCTHDRNPSQIARAMSVGAHEYMIKPFDRSILTAKFAQLGLTGHPSEMQSLSGRNRALS
jgi:two-component system chemotaxis response regulator CheY